MRIGAVIGVVVVACCAAGMAQAAPKPGAITCTDFMRDYPQALLGHRVSFEWPLTITRDLFGDEDGIDVHVLSTDAEVDGTLKCKGDMFRRFEVRVATPAEPQVLLDFREFEEASLRTVFRFDKPRAAAIVTALSSDADEYLRASIQRGDTYNAGKVEYHQGTSYDLGVIWTAAERTMVLVTQSDD